MNKLLLGLVPILLLLASPVLAIFGGEAINFTFAKCSYLTANITPSELEEWSAQSCIEQSAGNFYCVCNDNYILNLTPAQNSVGTFVITMTNFYGEVQQPIIRQVFVGNSNGWVPINGMCQIDGCQPPYQCIKNNSSWGKCLLMEGNNTEPQPVVEKGNITNVSVVQPMQITSAVGAEQPTGILYLLILIIIIISVVIGFLYREIKRDREK